MIYYVLLEDIALTVMNENNPLEPYNVGFQAGSEFALVARPKGCRVVMLSRGKHLVCTDRERLSESFEEVWTGTSVNPDRISAKGEAASEY